MSHLQNYTRINSKEGIIDETKIALKKSFNIKVSTDLVKRIVGNRSDSIRAGMENKVPRMIIAGIGSVVIKKGREAALRKAGKLTDERGIFKYQFKSVSADD